MPRRIEKELSVARRALPPVQIVVQILGQILWADLMLLTAITRAVNRLLLVAVGRSDLDATGVNFALVVPTA